MITFSNVCKRYIVEHVPGPWVLNGVSITIPSKARVGVIGNKGEGKSTFLRIITGAEKPTAGELDTSARIVSPATYLPSLESSLTGRQNAKFICRINGCADDLSEYLAEIEQRANLGKAFEKPVRTYTPPMKMRLAAILSMIFRADYYVTDGFNFAGEGGFRSKEGAEAALAKWIDSAGIIMTAQGALAESVLKQWCEAGIWIHQGRATWFDDISDAFEAYKASQPKKNIETEGITMPISDNMQAVTKAIKMMQHTIAVLNKGIKGIPVTVARNQIPPLKKNAEMLGMELMTKVQVEAEGCQVREGMAPILLCGANAGRQAEEYFDIKTQCEKNDC